ncbi:MAG: fluoride efflux transporter CrcB [Candidatus Omnitrophota bacterium]
MDKILYLSLGGIVGTLARYGLAGVVYRFFGTSFPFGTFAVNILGCLLVGFFASLSDKKFLLDPNTRLLLMVGFCGAFTTFSTLILETDHLLKDGEMIKAFLNILLSVVVGFIVFRVGIFLGKII